MSEEGARLFEPDALTRRERYQLITSLVVPRPIGWVSTWSAEGGANLAPFSFFYALAASPMLVGVSVGTRGGEPKDTLLNIRRFVFVKKKNHGILFKMIGKII